MISEPAPQHGRQRVVFDEYTDLCYGYNAFRANVLPTINVNRSTFEVETLINVRVAKAGLKVTEVPSVEQERIHGEIKLNPICDGVRVLRTIVRERVRSSLAAETFPSFSELDSWDPQRIVGLGMNDTLATQTVK